MTLSITAVIAVRNEAIYLQHLIPYLAKEGIEVILLDNHSSDGTADLFTPARYSNIISIRPLKYSGVFDLSKILYHKAQLTEHLKSDWIIHQDADEILQSPSHWGGLRQEIERAHHLGYNVLNFHELVMLPANPDLDDFITNNRQYYFFEPRPQRLLRVWRREKAQFALDDNGHSITESEFQIAPTAMLLKHFMVRSQQHAWEKYLHREFAERDVKRGWHGNRLGLTRKMLNLPPQKHKNLQILATPQSTPASLPPAMAYHYWHWKLHNKRLRKQQIRHQLSRLLRQF